MDMKILKKLFAGLAVAAGLAGAGSANAGVVCSGCVYNDNGATANTANVIGTYNPLNGDNGGVNHGGLGFGPFSDWMVFTIAPAGQVQAAASFKFSYQLSGFNAQVYAVTASTCPAFSTSLLATGNLLTGICSSVSLAAGPALYDTGILATNTFTTAFLNLSGVYAIHISGQSLSQTTPGNNFYNMNLTTRAAPIPEPGSLALVALALLGAGTVMRRRA